MKRIAESLSVMFFVTCFLCSCNGPMIITGNLLLKFMSDRGTGTAADPYIIENKEIDMTGKNANAGIQLQYTTAYVVIRNCHIFNGVYAQNNLNENDRADNLGILFQNVKNATIDNCRIEYNNMGMWLEGCHAVTVKNCRVLNNRYRGIYLMDSSNCDIEDNEVHSSSTEYGDDILLNTNFKKFMSVGQYNDVKYNETKKIHLMGNEYTCYNYIIGNTWEGGPSEHYQDSHVGENYYY